jgi:hypothetical protein
MVVVRFVRLACVKLCFSKHFLVSFRFLVGGKSLHVESHDSKILVCSRTKNVMCDAPISFFSEFDFECVLFRSDGTVRTIRSFQLFVHPSSSSPLF